jgi:hypothetical protein
MARYRSIAIRLCRLSSSQLNASLRMRFVISPEAPLQIRLKQIGIDHFGVIEIESLGCLRPARTIFQGFHCGGDQTISRIFTCRHQCRINRWFAKDTRYGCDIRLKIRFFDKHVGQGEGVRVIGAEAIYSKNVFNRCELHLWSCNNSREALN